MVLAGVAATAPVVEEAVGGLVTAAEDCSRCARADAITSTERPRIVR